VKPTEEPSGEESCLKDGAYDGEEKRRTRIA
jgi:hypothetical protein